MKNYKVEKSDNSYTIELSDGKIIKTDITDQLINDLKSFNIIDGTSSIEEQQKQLEGYLIIAAQQFVDQGLFQIKQVDGKIDTSIGGLDDEF